MSKRKLTKKELLEKKVIEDRKFNRTLLISFGSFFILAIFFNIFIVFRYDTKFVYRKYALYSKEVSQELVCMNDDKLLTHKSLKLNYKGKDYFFCNRDCYEHLVNHYKEDAFIPDPLSGDTICKANALIGLKNRGEPEIVYFQNRKTFNQYYKSKNK